MTVVVDEDLLAKALAANDEPIGPVWAKTYSGADEAGLVDAEGWWSKHGHAGQVSAGMAAPSRDYFDSSSLSRALGSLPPVMAR